jgi:hypothetical protein
LGKPCKCFTDVCKLHSPESCPVENWFSLNPVGSFVLLAQQHGLPNFFGFSDGRLCCLKAAGPVASCKEACSVQLGAAPTRFRFPASLANVGGVFGDDFESRLELACQVGWGFDRTTF